MAVLTDARVPLYNGKRCNYQEHLQLADDTFQYEIVEGVMTVVPAPYRDHQQLVVKLCFYLERFLQQNPLGRISVAPRDVKFSETLKYQPDILFISKDRLAIDQDQYVAGAPDLIIEILSPSTKARDLGDKRQDYERFGVQEYWIMDPSNLSSSQFYSLQTGTYQALPTSNGILHSRVLTGFQLNLIELQQQLI